MSDSIWGYQPTTGRTAGTDLTGCKVEATDGKFGKVDKHSDAPACEASRTPACERALPPTDVTPP